MVMRARRVKLVGSKTGDEEGRGYGEVFFRASGEEDWGPGEGPTFSHNERIL
jgi:hypothetical protein